MKLTSFMRSDYNLVPVEVEISLLPGLPQITFLGLPDAMIRESVGRIKSALKYQGFKFPEARQVLVQLRPSHLKKTSHGLDLAVAAALLWETGQIPKPDDDSFPQVYGELSLKGEVICPDDLGDLPLSESARALWTGVRRTQPLEFPTLQLKELRDFSTPSFVHPTPALHSWKRPPLDDLKLNSEAAGLLEVIASGEHSALFAGPPGSGKTTAAEALNSLLPEPPLETIRTASKLARIQGETLSWRPFIQPHHSISSLSMIGGGVPPRPGEVTRAHGGVLLMDEFLEFHPTVQEALREPIEKGEIYISRGMKRGSFPARFLLMATTNLCKCGKFVPEQDELCTCSRRDRNLYLARLRGPFVDRFAIVGFTQRWGQKQEVPLASVFERIEKAAEFRKQRRGQTVLNSCLSEGELRSSLRKFQREQILPQGVFSKRRMISLLRVARTYADLDESMGIENRHIEKAMLITIQSFKALERAGG